MPGGGTPGSRGHACPGVPAVRYAVHPHTAGSAVLLPRLHCSQGARACTRTTTSATPSGAFVRCAKLRHLVHAGAWQPAVLLSPVSAESSTGKNPPESRRPPLKGLFRAMSPTRSNSVRSSTIFIASKLSQVTLLMRPRGRVGCLLGTSSVGGVEPICAVPPGRHTLLVSPPPGSV